MCLAIVALAAHPRFALVVAANRDEYHARPAAPAAWGPEPPFVDVIAGRDLQAGGTWFGVARRGRFALVTNVREPRRHNPAAPSRGNLVPQALASHATVAATQAELLIAGRDCNGYNLVFGGMDNVLWMSNRAAPSRLLQAGVHGVSNAALDTPWPKLTRTRESVGAWAARGDADVEALFAIMADRGTAADAALPATGVSLEWERRLSAPFIVGADYGTRCTTVLAIGLDGRAYFEERSFDNSGAPSGTVVHEFTVAR